MNLFKNQAQELNRCLPIDDTLDYTNNNPQTRSLPYVQKLGEGIVSCVASSQDPNESIASRSVGNNSFTYF